MLDHARRRFRVLSAVIFILSVMYLWDFGEVRYRKNRANDLLVDVRQLRVGVTSGDEVKRLSKRYNGTFNGPFYQLVVASPYLLIHNEPYSIPPQKIWSIAAQLSVAQDRLTAIDLSVGLIQSGNREMGMLVIADSRTLPGGAPYSVSYVVGDPFQETLDVRLTPGASSDQIRRATDVNLDCFTRFLECRSICDLLPSEWGLMSLEMRMRARDARGKAIDPECQAAIGQK